MCCLPGAWTSDVNASHLGSLEQPEPSEDESYGYAVGGVRDDGSELNLCFGNVDNAERDSSLIDDVEVCDMCNAVLPPAGYQELRKRHIEVNLLLALVAWSDQDELFIVTKMVFDLCIFSEKYRRKLFGDF